MMGDEQDLHILGVIMMKYSFKKGLHKFAKKKGIYHKRTNPATCHDDIYNNVP